MILVLSVVACVYGATWWAMSRPLAWFVADTRAKFTRRLDRISALVVIFAIAPALGIASIVVTIRAFIRHQRVRAAIRDLPHQADPEQQHIVDELKNERFYEAAHHPTGTLGGDQ